jgi:hypothetical protein
MELANYITPKVCESTVFEDSWVWYCDEHQQHGTGGSAKEAEYQATAHAEFNTSVYVGGESDEEIENAENYVPYLSLDEEGQFLLDEEIGEECELYIISEKMNKTFNYGDDYSDDTPNEVGDLEVAQEIRKKLGLP